MSTRLQLATIGFRAVAETAVAIQSLASNVRPESDDVGHVNIRLAQLDKLIKRLKLDLASARSNYHAMGPEEK